MRIGYIMVVAGVLAASPAMAQGMYNGDNGGVHHSYSNQYRQDHGDNWQGQNAGNGNDNNRWQDRADNGNYNSRWQDRADNRHYNNQQGRADNGNYNNRWQDHADNGNWQNHQADRRQGDEAQRHADRYNGQGYDQQQANAEGDWQARHDQAHGDHDHGLTVQFGH